MLTQLETLRLLGDLIRDWREHERDRSVYGCRFSLEKLITAIVADETPPEAAGRRICRWRTTPASRGHWRTECGKSLWLNDLRHDSGSCFCLFCGQPIVTLLET